MTTRWIFGVGIALGLVAGIFAPRLLPFGNEAQGDGAPSGRRAAFTPAVSMTVAEPGAVAKRIEVLGEARALRSVTLISEVAGLVDEVLIAPGQRVKAGDVLLRIENDDQEIALARARAQYPIAKANAERFERLEKENAASAQEAEDAYNRYKAAEADLRSAEVALERRSVIAPFGGIAGITEIEPGDYLRTGDLIATLDDISSVIVEFSVPQEAAGAVNIGQAVSARLSSGGGAAHKGAITAIDSRIDPQTRSLRIEAKFENDDLQLIPGAVFAVETTSEAKRAIALPGLAIQWDRSGAYVWRRGAEGQSERASIVILQRNDDEVIVEGDIAAGDVIVGEGADRVRAGMILPNLEKTGAGAPSVAVWE